MKFTFKTTKPTGRYSSFFFFFYYIKLKRFVVGLIDPEPPHKIRFAVLKDNPEQSKNPNCDWEWRIIKGEFDTVEAAKAFGLANAVKIQAQLKLKAL